MFLAKEKEKEEQESTHTRACAHAHTYTRTHVQSGICLHTHVVSRLPCKYLSTCAHMCSTLMCLRVTKGQQIKKLQMHTPRAVPAWMPWVPAVQQALQYQHQQSSLSGLLRERRRTKRTGSWRPLAKTARMMILTASVGETSSFLSLCTMQTLLLSPSAQCKPSSSLPLHNAKPLLRLLL